MHMLLTFCSSLRKIDMPVTYWTGLKKRKRTAYSINSSIQMHFHAYGWTFMHTNVFKNRILIQEKGYRWLSCGEFNQLFELYLVFSGWGRHVTGLLHPSQRSACNLQYYWELLWASRFYYVWWILNLHDT